MGSLVNKISLNKVVGNLLGVLNTRSKDIVSRRFGLKSGRKETLDFIGKGYGITRERVRQIEEAAFKQMRAHLSSGFEKNIQPYIVAALNTLEEHGGALKDESLFTSLLGKSSEKTAIAALSLIFSLDVRLQRFAETDDSHSFWALSKDHANKSMQVVNTLIKSFKSAEEPISREQLYQFYKSQESSVAVDQKAFLASVEISKNISNNIFGEVGLASWSNVRPRGVRDKAFLVLKRDGTPKHFREITKMINNVKFSTHKANIQTVHNELIKDKRFVLVGRGTYGLAEWGYKAGTVRDVLVDLLKSSTKPLSRQELIAQVLSHRMVKENTILLNLQDSKVFKKSDDGRYSLREA